MYINDTYLGTYSLPTTIPVLAEGETKITVFPGIRDNGSSTTPDIYTFYKRYEVTLDLQPDVTTEVLPRTTYEDNAKFRLVEAFESVGHAMRADLDENSATNVVISQADAFEGNSSGRITLTRQDSFIVVGTNPLVEFPQSGGTAYVELDYKNDVRMALLLIGLDSRGEVVFQSEFNRIINPRETWNKIYLNFTLDFRNMEIQRNVASYQLMLRSIIPSENGRLILDEADIYLDNLKIIHF